MLEDDGRVFAAASIRQILSYLRNMLGALAASPERKLSRLTLAVGQALNSVQPGSDVEPRESSIPALFDRQAAATPDAIALRYVDDTGNPATMTYRCLAQRASSLALRLLAQGAAPETRIAVLLGSSAARPIAILAIMMTGACYVALDARWPPERLAFVLDDAAATMIVADALHAPRFGFTTRPVLVPDMADYDDAPDAGRLLGPAPRNIAYVLYTSGSTGVPKGVAIEHRNAVALLRWAEAAFSLQERAEILAATPLCFDLSIFEMFLPLVSGTTCVLADSVLELHALAERSAPTLINTVPSVLEEALRAGAIPPSVTTVNFAGEPLHRQTVDALYALEGVRRVLNLYGPTETTTYSSAAALTPTDVSAPSIGTAIAGTRIDVIDELGHRVPVGVQGELAISGMGVTRGYLGQPDLTAFHFRPDPHPERPGARRYHTGDIARAAPHGSLRFLGRRDRQIKLRGYRIELPEIEAALRGHPAVRSTAVTVQSLPGSAGQVLAAHVVTDADAHCNAADLRDYLTVRLPEYMVPASIVLVDALAQTVSGKLDLSLLAAPVASCSAAADTATERQLVDIWREILDRDQIDVERPFFELGGTSLLLVRLAALVYERLDVSLPVLEFVHHPSIRGLARHLDLRVVDTGPTQGDAARRHRMEQRIDALRARAS